MLLKFSEKPLNLFHIIHIRNVFEFLQKISINLGEIVSLFLYKTFQNYKKFSENVLKICLNFDKKLNIILPISTFKYQQNYLKFRWISFKIFLNFRKVFPIIFHYYLKYLKKFILWLFCRLCMKKNLRRNWKKIPGNFQYIFQWVWKVFCKHFGKIFGKFKNFWVKFPERFRIISGENFQEKLRNI